MVAQPADHPKKNKLKAHRMTWNDTGNEQGAPGETHQAVVAPQSLSTFGKRTFVPTAPLWVDERVRPNYHQTESKAQFPDMYASGRKKAAYH